MCLVLNKFAHVSLTVYFYLYVFLQDMCKVQIHSTIIVSVFLCVLAEMLSIEHILRRYWDVNKYTGNKLKVPAKKKGTAVTENQPYLEGDDVKTLQQVIASVKFWGFSHVVCQVGYQAELLGRWCEGCACYEAHRCLYNSLSGAERREIPKPPDCDFQSCRAPELACGTAIEKFQLGLCQSEHSIMTLTAGMSETDRADIRQQHDLARSKLEVEVTLKMAHWQQLPHLLCGLAHWDSSVACTVAKRALDLWNKGQNCEHCQSRRFLDPNWTGVPGFERERALRPFALCLCIGTIYSRCMCVYCWNSLAVHTHSLHLSLQCSMQCY